MRSPPMASDFWLLTSDFRFHALPLEHLREQAPEVLEAIRLRDEPAEAVALVLGHDRVVRVAARDDPARRRVESQDALHGFLAAHAARDREVHEHGVESPPGLEGARVAVDGLGAVARELG